jgi:hypothetical protein
MVGARPMAGQLTDSGSVYRGSNSVNEITYENRYLLSHLTTNTNDGKTRVSSSGENRFLRFR